MTQLLTFWRHQRRRFIPAGLLAAGLAAALASAGCGSSSVSNVIDPVANAATVSNQAPGYRMTMTMQMSSPALPVPVTAHASGAVNVPQRTGEMNLSMQLPNVPQITQALGSDQLSMQMIFQRLTVFMKFPAAIAAKMPAGRPWVKMDLAKLAAAQGMPGLGALSSASPMSSDPSQFLQYLKGSGNVSKVGSATIDGRPCAEYKATINLDKAVDRVPAQNRAAVRTTIQRLEAALHSHQMPVLVWIDGQHLVRQMVLHMSIALPTGQSMTMAMQENIPQYGPQPAPATPPASQVTDLSALMQGGSAA